MNDIILILSMSYIYIIWYHFNQWNLALTANQLTRTSFYVADRID